MSGNSKTITIPVQFKEAGKSMANLVNNLTKAVGEVDLESSLGKQATSVLNQLRSKMSDYNQILLEPTIDQAGMKHAESIIESFVSKALKLSESINNGDVFSFNLSKEEITEIGTLTDKVKELSLALNQLKKNGSTKSTDSYLTEIGKTDFLNRARKSSKTFKSDATLSKNKDMVEAEAKQARDEIARIEKERAELQKQASEEQTRLNEQRRELQANQDRARRSENVINKGNFLAGFESFESNNLRTKSGQFRGQTAVLNEFMGLLMKDSEGGRIAAKNRGGAEMILRYMGMDEQTIQDTLQRNAPQIRQAIARALDITDGSRDAISNTTFERIHDVGVGSNRYMRSHATAARYAQYEQEKKAVQDSQNQIKTTQAGLKKTNAAITEKNDEIKKIQAMAAELDSVTEALGKFAEQLNNTEIKELQNQVDNARDNLNNTKRKIKGAHTVDVQGISEDAPEIKKDVHAGLEAGSEALRGMDESEQFTNNLKQSIKQWMSAQQVVNMVKDGIRQAYQDIKGLDTAMTNIAVVTNMSVSDLWGKINDYMSIAQQYGVTTQGVYEVSQLYYQQGLSTNEVMAATTETLKMARIAGMDYADAADAMTVAIRAFKMEMTDAEHVTDVYSKVAAVTASDSEELAIAMSKTASSAESVGSSFENTTAMLAVMIETTRESAQNLGSALKSIISRYGEMKVGLTVDSEGEDIDYNKVDTALKSIGISIKDAQGQFRDFDDVIFELSEKWDSLDKNTQRYIATIMAGNRQQSRFIALVDNWERLDEVANAAQDSEDAGLLQYAKTLDSLDTKLNNIKTSFQQFYMSLINGPVIGAALDFINKLLKGLNKLGNWQAILNIAGLISGIKLLGSTIIGGLSNPLSKVYERYQTHFKKITELARKSGREAGRAHAQGMQEGQNQYLNGQPQGAQKPSGNAPAAPTSLASKTSWKKWGTTQSGKNVGSIVSLISSAFGVAGSAIGTALTASGHRTAGAWTSLAGNAASGAAMGAAAGPWGAVIGGLAGVASGIPNLVKALDKNTQRAEETEKAREEAEKKNIKRAEAKEEYSQLKDLIAKVEETEKNKFVDDESYQEWISANNALVEAYPELLGYMDSEGNAIADLTNKTQLLDNAMDKAAEASLSYYKARKAELDAQIAEASQYQIVHNFGEWSPIGKGAIKDSDGGTQFVKMLLKAGYTVDDIYTNGLDTFDIEDIFKILKINGYDLQDLKHAAGFVYNNKGGRVEEGKNTTYFWGDTNQQQHTREGSINWDSEQGENGQWAAEHNGLVKFATILADWGGFFSTDSQGNINFNQQILDYNKLSSLLSELQGEDKKGAYTNLSLLEDSENLDGHTELLYFYANSIKGHSDEVIAQLTKHSSEWKEVVEGYNSFALAFGGLDSSGLEELKTIVTNLKNYSWDEINTFLNNNNIIAGTEEYIEIQKAWRSNTAISRGRLATSLLGKNENFLYNKTGEEDTKDARDRFAANLNETLSGYTSEDKPLAEFIRTASLSTLEAYSTAINDLNKLESKTTGFHKQAIDNQEKALTSLIDLLGGDEEGITAQEDTFIAKAIELLGSEDGPEQLKELAEEYGIVINEDFTKWLTNYQNGTWSSFSTYVATVGEEMTKAVSDMDDMYAANEKGLTIQQAQDYFAKYGKGKSWEQFFTRDNGKLQIANIDEIFNAQYEKLKEQTEQYNNAVQSLNLSTEDEDLRDSQLKMYINTAKERPEILEQSFQGAGFTVEQSSEIVNWLASNQDATLEKFETFLKTQGLILKETKTYYENATKELQKSEDAKTIQKELEEESKKYGSYQAVADSRGKLGDDAVSTALAQWVSEEEGRTTADATSKFKEYFDYNEAEKAWILKAGTSFEVLTQAFGKAFGTALWEAAKDSDFDKIIKDDSLAASLPETFSNLIENAEETTLADVKELYDSIHGEGSFEKIDITKWQDAITAARNGTTDALIDLILTLAKDAETKLGASINTDFSEKYNAAAKNSTLLAAEKALAGSADNVFEKSEFEEILKGYKLGTGDYTVDAQGNVTIKKEKYQELLQQLPISLRNEQLALAEKETESAIKAVEDLGSKLASGDAGTQDYMDVFGDKVSQSFQDNLSTLLYNITNNQDKFGYNQAQIIGMLTASGKYRTGDEIKEAYDKLVASYKDSTNANVVRYFELTQKAIEGTIKESERVELDQIIANSKGTLSNLQDTLTKSGVATIETYVGVVSEILNNRDSFSKDELVSTLTSTYEGMFKLIFANLAGDFDQNQTLNSLKTGDGVYDPSELASAFAQMSVAGGAINADQLNGLFAFDQKANGMVLDIEEATALIAKGAVDDITKAYLQALIAAENNRRVDALIESHELFSSFEADLAAVLNDYTNVSLDTLVGMYESIFGEDTIEPKKVEEYRQAIEEAKEGNTTALANHIGALAATANAHGIANVDIDMLAAALEDGTRTLVQTLIDRIKAAIEGAISRTDMLSLGKDLDIANIEDYFIRTSDGYEVTQEGMMVLGTKMVEQFDSAYEAAEAMYELFVGEDKLYSGYKELEDSAARLREEAKNLESTDVDRAKILREQADMLDHMADVSRRMADDASFDFMNQDRTDGWGDTWDTYVSNVNQAKDALNSLQAGESIAVRDFQNMMGFMGDQLGFDAEKNGTDVFASLGLDTTKIKQTMKDIAAATAAANGFKADDPLAFLGQDLASFNSLVEKSDGAELYQLYVDTIVAASGELDSIDADIMLDFGLSMKNTGKAMSDSLAQVAKDQIQFLKGIRNMLVAMKGIDGINANMSIGLKYVTTGPNGALSEEREMTLGDVLGIANDPKSLNKFKKVDGSSYTLGEINANTQETLQSQLGSGENSVFNRFFGDSFNLLEDNDMLGAIVGFNEKFGELTAEQWQTVAQGAAQAVGDLDPEKDSENYRKAIIGYLKDLTDKGTVIGTDLLELSNIQIGLSSIGVKYNLGNDGKIHLEGDYDVDQVRKALEAQFASQNQSIEVTIKDGIVTVNYVNPTIKTEFSSGKDSDGDGTSDNYKVDDSGQGWYEKEITVDGKSVTYKVNATDGTIVPVDKSGNPIEMTDAITNALKAEFGEDNIVSVEAGKVQYKVASAEPVDSAALLQTINDNLASITSLLNAGTVEINLSIGDDTEETILTLERLNTLITSLQNGDFTAIDSLVLLATALSNANTNLGIVALGNIFSSITANSAALASFDAAALVAQLQAFNNLTLDDNVVDQLVTLADLLNAIPDVDIDLSLTEAETTKSDIQDITDLINKVPASKSFTISANIPQATAISQLAEALQKLKTALLAIGNKTFTITANVNGSINTKYGNANATGNVPIYYDGPKAKGNFSLLALGGALASGTLMGELGPELYVQGGHYYVAGTNGPEFVDLHDDAIVFNHLQTADLLGKGHTSRTGKPRISEERSVAFATGNVSGPAHANSNLDSAIAAIDAAIAMWQNILNATAQNLANGGNGGGGGGNGAEPPIADLQEWYNLTREIARLEQEINTILAERENITDGREYLRNLRQQQDYLKTQLDTQKQLYHYQQAQLERQKKEINDNKVWSQFLTVDTDGRLRYKNGNETDGGKGALEVLADLNKMTLANQVKTVKGYGYKAYDNTGKDITKDLSDEELVQHFFDDLQGQIDAYDALYDTVHATEQAMAELETQIAEIDAEILQNTMDLEAAIYDVIVKRWEKEIEKMEEYTEKVEEANEAYIDGLKDALDAEKDRYDQEKSDEELSQLQRRLNLLRRTGGSSAEIADLEQQLNESLKDQYFDEQEKLIEELEKTSEEQIERLEQQITIQQETLEYQKEAGLIWNQVAEIMELSEDEMNAWFSTNNTELLSKSANELAQAVQDFAIMVGIYREDMDVWRPNYQKAQEASKGKWEGQKGTDANGDPTYTAGEMWAKSDDSVLTSQLYDSLGDEQKQSIQDTYARTYANSIAAGKTEEEAKTDAYNAAEEMLNTFTGGTAKNSNTGREMRYHYVYNIYKGEKGEIYKIGSQVQEFKAFGKKDNYGHQSTTEQQLKDQVKADLKEIWTKGWKEPGKTNVQKQIEDAIANKGKTDVESLKENYKNMWSAYQKSLNSAKKRYNKAYGYSKGGIVDYTGTAVVHGTPSKPEAFLNAKQTAMISDAVRAAGEGNVLDGIRATLASLDSSIRSLVTNNITTQSSNITVAPGAVVLNVAKLNDSYDIEELSNDIMNRMVNIASKATNRGVNRR